MKIEGLSTFKNFKEYFDGVKKELTKDHKDAVEKINENRGDGVQSNPASPNNSSNSANL